MNIANLDFAAPPSNDADEIASVFALDGDSSSAPEAPPSEGGEAPVAAPAAGQEEKDSPVTPAAPAATPPAAAPQASEAPATPPPASPETPAAPLPALADQAAPAAPAAPDAQALELASLRAQVAALTEAASKPTPQAQQPGTAPQPNAEAGDEAPVYQLSIPNELGQAIFSEDGATSMAGMTQLVNSLAQHIHKTVRAEFKATLDARDARVAEASNATSEAAAIQQMQEEYYGAFPAHNTPLIKSIVHAESLAMGQQFPHLPWGEEYKAALGARVNAALATLTGGQQPTTPPVTPAAVPPTAPAAFAPTTPARSGIPAFERTDGQVDLINDTFAPD